MRYVSPSFVVVEKRTFPGVRVDDEAVPLHQQHEFGLDVVNEFFDDEVRIIVARGQRRDAEDVDAGELRRDIGDEQRPRECAFLQALADRGKREIVIDAVDAAERDAIEIEHGRGSWASAVAYRAARMVCASSRRYRGVRRQGD